MQVQPIPAPQTAWAATLVEVEFGLRVEVIDSFTAFAQLQGAWADLLARDPESGLFLSWPWLAESFVRNPGRWKVLTVREGSRQGRYLCFLPLKVRLHWSRSSGRLQTQLDPGGRLGFSEYVGFLCDPAEEDRAIPALARHLAQTGWSDLELRYEPHGTAVADLCRSVSAGGFPCGLAALPHQRR